jgi:hypothetical protein
MKLKDKLKKEVAANLKVKQSPRLLFRFTEPHYKAKMSSTQGFGAHDLKPTYLELYTDLLKKHGSKIIVKMEDMSKKTVALYIK